MVYARDFNTRDFAPSWGGIWGISSGGGPDINPDIKKGT